MVPHSCMGNTAVGDIEKTPFRIRSASRKSLFVMAFFVTWVLTFIAARALDLPAYLIDEVAEFLVVTAVYVGVRAFRGEGEEIAPSRPWWRMSAKPTASFVLASYFIVRSAFSAAALFWALASGWVDLMWILLCIADPLIAGLYLNSGIRLVRHRSRLLASAEIGATDSRAPANNNAILP